MPCGFNILTQLHVDAFTLYVGAFLQQQSPGSQSWSPLGFFSKKLSPSQVKWSAFDHELWACFSGIRHFGFILEGRSFNIFTEYRCLDGKAVQAALLHG